MRIYPTIFIAVFTLLFSATCWSADFETGQKAYDRGDYEAALAEWQPLAEAGHVGAQFGMGLLYSNGFGVPFDNEQAFKWYKLAANQDNADAQCNLGVIFANGWGVAQSDEQALEWYGRAADQGVTEAQTNLGRMYLHGFGVEENKVQAHMWFAIATELGDISAKLKRDEIANKLSADQLAEATNLANAWMESHQSMLASHTEK
jgi:TPR repeat protein